MNTPTDDVQAKNLAVIQETYDQLITKIEKNPRVKKDLPAIKEAYQLAHDAHEGQVRKSGEPYIIHPLLVSTILLDLGMDGESVIAGLLHDTIEDTVFTYEDIEARFGETVAKLVNGVTKLLKIEYNKEGSRNQNMQAENYRKMFLAMADDVRVIMIKIADRLHNMRTLNYMTPEKQKKKAQETMDIYAPLALRLGISVVRNELEDLAFKYLEPEAYQDLAKKIQRKQTERKQTIKDMVDELSQKIKKSSFGETYGCEFDIKGRPKHFFSIYKKMKTKNMSLEQIYDLFAVRILVETDTQCYAMLGSIHEHYHPIQDRFKDYISVPKSNGYKSLHTTVIGRNGEPFEIQIRTREMHRIAEYGIAAHWKYKDKPGAQVNMQSDEAKLGVISSSIQRLLDIQEELAGSENDEEYLNELKTELDIYQGSIYCYTPNGDVIEMKVGSTPVDFAYAIHSAVGNTMVGAKVNGLMVTIDHTLATGDRIEILTSRNTGGPKPEWLNFVQTTQARNRIKSALNTQNQEASLESGRQLLDQEAIRRRFTTDELMTEKGKQFLLKRYNYTEWDLFVAAVGRRNVSEESVIKHLIELRKREQERLRTLELKNLHMDDEQINLAELINVSQNKHRKKKKAKNTSGVVIDGVGDLDVRFSKCCTPVPGDEIVGFITRGRGVSVHRTDCINVISMPQDEKKRLLDTYWDVNDATASYQGEISLECEDSAGLLINIGTIMNDQRINITSINSRKENDIVVLSLNLDIGSRDQMDRLCERMLKLEQVHAIRR